MLQKLMWNLKLRCTLLICMWLNHQIVIAAASVKEIPLSSNRIVGGNLAYISDFPYLMQIHAFNTFICGGTLVTKRHVVTAAHCVQGLSKHELMVIGGNSFIRNMGNTTNVGVQRAVSRIIIPKSYRYISMHMDVAVIKLVDEMKGNNIDQLALCDVTLKANENIEIAGWGFIKEKANEASTQLRSTRVPLMSRTKCQRMYKGRNTISTSMFCASKAGVRDACAGDSGGPAVYQNQLCGITSWGIGCARKNYPGVYTNVKIVKSFILEAIKL